MEEYPTCPICSDIYGVSQTHIKAPKILKCGDCFCKECLEQMIQKEKEEFFICPICKQKIKKEENIEEYVTNKLIIGLINSSFNLSNEEAKNNTTEKIIEYNIVLLGNSNIGKTSIFNRLSKETFSEKLLSTVGCEMAPYYIKYKNRIFRLNFFDPSGQERFQSITKGFLRHKDGVLFIFDLSDQKTFDNLKSWYKLYKEENEHVVGLLIGNKCDCERKVEEELAKKFAKDYGLKKYLETSAKFDKNIKKSIAYLLEAIIKSKRDNKDKNVDDISFSIASNKHKEAKQECEC